MMNDIFGISDLGVCKSANFALSELGKSFSHLTTQGLHPGLMTGAPLALQVDCKSS